MNLFSRPAGDLGPDDASRLLDVLIRAGLLLALALLCYGVFSPFLTLMIWAVTLYPDDLRAWAERVRSGP